MISLQAHGDLKSDITYNIINNFSGRVCKCMTGSEINKSIESINICLKLNNYELSSSTISDIRLCFDIGYNIQDHTITPKFFSNTYPTVKLKLIKTEN